MMRERILDLVCGSGIAAPKVALVCLTLSACAPPQAFLAGDSGTAPVVILVSGDSGTAPYATYARAIGELGYRAILVAGRSISMPEREAAEKLRALIHAAPRASRSRPSCWQASRIGISTAV